MKNAYLNVMATIVALCMLVIAFFTVFNAKAARSEQDKLIKKINDIEDQIENIIDGRSFYQDSSEERESEVSVIDPSSSADPQSIEELSDAVDALSASAALLQEQVSDMASIDYETLNETIERLNQTALSLEETAGRLSAFFG